PWNYFPSTDKENTNKDITGEDCIHESNYAMSKANATTWDEIVNKMGVRKSEFVQIRQRGKERCHMEVDHVLVKDQTCICKQAFTACICILHLQLAFASKHLHLAFAACICNQAFAASVCKQAFYPN
ncbi:hypothetical protein Tco_1231362, partial [Tanacetum coccineum]